jgi:Flp pilus assembly protein TadG
VNNESRRRVPPIARSTWGRRRRAQRGAVAVEFALILPILLLLVLGIIEFGFGYHAWDATQNAAREGARLGAVSFDENEIIQRTKNAASVLDDSKLIVQVTCAPEGSTVFGSCQWNEGDTVRVQVDYVYDYVTPLPGFVGMGPQMSMTSIAEARFEGQ